MRTLIACLALALAAAPARADHPYQFTGVVTEVNGDELVVEKSAKETWHFTVDAATKGKTEVGDKVTVHYVMVAKSIEPKGKGAKKKDKKK